MAEICKKTVKEVAQAALGIFVVDTLRIAAENYGPDHSIISGMKRLYLAALSGKEFAQLTDEDLEGFERVLEDTRAAVEEE